MKNIRVTKREGDFIVKLNTGLDDNVKYGDIFEIYEKGEGKVVELSPTECTLQSTSLILSSDYTIVGQLTVSSSAPTAGNITSYIKPFMGVNEGDLAKKKNK